MRPSMEYSIVMVEVILAGDGDGVVRVGAGKAAKILRPMGVETKGITDDGR